MALKTDYKDDILDVSQNTKRKYTMIENQDGTVSFDDETVYSQEGDSFGASDMNAVNSEVNEVVNNLGAKNMLPNNATSQVVAGITYTINSDGSITISGTSTASNGIVLSSNQLLHKGTYKTTTGQTQEEDADAFIYVQDTNTQRVISRSNDLEVPSQFTLANDTLVNYGVWVDVGKTVNVTIYPMVRPASIADDTYAPYAQTNKELTANLNGFKFYPTGTGIVGLISDDSAYTDEDGNYVVWGTATADALVEASPNTYKSVPSAEDTRGKVGADTATPFSGGKTNYTLIENGGNSLPYGAVWTRITSYESNKNYLIILTMIGSGGDGIASFEVENGNIYLLHSTSSYINDSNRLALQINNGYIEARNNGNTAACKLNYIIWEVSANYTLIENGGNYLPYGAVWTKITRFKERKNYLVGMKIEAGSSGVASFEIKNGNVQLKHSTSSYINDSNYLSLRVNGDYIEARNCTNYSSGTLNYAIWEINA